ncbi:hypothetical protein ACETAC_06470 [Aceticella autotrophica]|uniref:Uncharacterized protein n=1 Tax=Aceticella autotrophica TaxID=2755338 RepID=A0A974Y443_9THEO|nr:hypothetical protein [Aceticella autotrophica]QSZ26560.1 hypothetical protein ACETAC_06470 [Aceticella autotrophica]
MRKVISTKIKEIIPFSSLIGKEIVVLDYVITVGTFSSLDKKRKKKEDFDYWELANETFHNAIYVMFLFYEVGDEENKKLTKTSSNLITAKLDSTYGWTYFRPPFKAKITKQEKYYDIDLI